MSRPCFVPCALLRLRLGFRAIYTYWVADRWGIIGVSAGLRPPDLAELRVFPCTNETGRVRMRALSNRRELVRRKLGIQGLVETLKR